MKPSSQGSGRGIEQTSQTPARSEWILIALHTSIHERLSPVQLQKVLFVLGERRPKSVGNQFYRFRPYHYGPFDPEVYHDADHLAAQGFVLVEPTRGRSLRAYSLTDKGSRAAQVSEAKIPKKTLTYLEEVVHWAESLPFEALVRAIYDAYPAMRVNSIFREPDSDT